MNRTRKVLAHARAKRIHHARAAYHAKSLIPGVFHAVATEFWDEIVHRCLIRVLKHELENCK